jgi:hypothetical protein
MPFITNLLQSRESCHTDTCGIILRNADLSGPSIGLCTIFRAQTQPVSSAPDPTKSALKIGTETRGPIRDVTFEDCDVFDGERGIVLYAQDGGPVERVVWRNIRLFMIDWPQEKNSGTVFYLVISRRGGATPVRQCRIENVTANWVYHSEFAGLPDAPLDGVTLRHIQIKVDPPKSGKPSLFVCGDNVRLSLEGLTLDWQGNQARWAGVLSGRGLTFSDSPPLPMPEQATGSP